ncbi:unnamed protein product (macronuclear) [Paramecium tetraurelia]|uniref:Uncharacterized protein n=1 Tax=Paramecium tetraurelia TaxID=5888 RepID=A0DVQ3_PARTE|nr:uncharacterized protein GSPATT00020773001 [Paramecium tetraurelia]CAK87120.1 unnamed protein product [Paramecium tetraurelia]|eukprot:XP_001454517.1 hypothetical protein (macronuclear) [Paramecium tetraurelia strain d4-2]
MHSLPRLTSQSINCHINNQQDCLSGRRFHLGENVLYNIHKQALSEYLKSGVIDQKIVQLNLLKMSKLNSYDLSVLKDVYSQPNSSRLDQQQANIILSKIKTQRNPKSINFNQKSQNELSQEEIDFMSIEEQLKQCLRSKINTSKVFNGTYLIDPTINDLKKINLHGKRQLHHLLSKEPQKKLNKKTSLLQRQSSIVNPLQYRKPSIQSMEVEDVTQYMSSKILESKANVEQLVERLKQPEISEKQKYFFYLVQNCDCKALNSLIQDKSFDKSIINEPDQKGFCAVHIAIKKQNPQLLKLLLKNGARTNILTKNGKSLQQLSELYQNQEIIEILETQKYYK